MLRGDAGEASDLSQQFLARAGSRLAVFADLVQPALDRVGDLWYRGRVRMDDEQRAASVLEPLVGLLPPTPSRPPVPVGSRCLLTLMPGERHTVGPWMFALALEDEGWEVELLDQDYRPDDLSALVDRTRPQFVGVSAGYLPSVHRMSQVVRGVCEVGVPVLVGGGAFNRAGDLWRRVGATAFGPDPRVGTVLARRLARR